MICGLTEARPRKVGTHLTWLGLYSPSENASHQDQWLTFLLPGDLKAESVGKFLPANLWAVNIPKKSHEKSRGQLTICIHLQLLVFYTPGKSLEATRHPCFDFKRKNIGEVKGRRKKRATKPSTMSSCFFLSEGRSWCHRIDFQDLLNAPTSLKFGGCSSSTTGFTI